jgi:hypothetical protein
MDDESNCMELKGGTLKGWRFRTDRARALFTEYAALGMSPSVMWHQDTPEQVELLCALVDECDTIWIESEVTRDEAKAYLRGMVR